MRKQCRLCLNTNSDNYYSIHEEYKSGPTYAEFVQQLAGVEIEYEDGLPQEICEICCYEIQRIFEFGLGVRKADEKLRNHLDSDSILKDQSEQDVEVFEQEYFCQEDDDGMNETQVCVVEEVLELDAEHHEGYVVEHINEGEEIHIVEVVEIDQENFVEADEKHCSRKEDLLEELAHVAANQENVDVIDNHATEHSEDNAKDENDEDYLIEFDPNESLSHNLKPPKWKCVECKMILRGDVSYEGHMNMHKKLRPHKCLQCSCEFRCRAALKKHQELRHLNPINLQQNKPKQNVQTTYFCGECKLWFNTEVTLYLHEIMIHQKHTAITTCQFCSNIPVENLKEHLQTFHNSDYTIYGENSNDDNTNNSTTAAISSTGWQCYVCSETYQSLEQLDDHQKVCHNSEEEQSQDLKVDYLDDVPTSTEISCDVTTTTTANGKETSSVQCEICKRKLLSKNLHKHMELHNRKDKEVTEESRKYLCSQCPREFLNSKSLRQHEKIHIGESIDLVYVCGECSRQYASEFLLETHRKQAHKERNNICTICGNAFKLKNQLVNHMKLHLEKNIPCPHCEKKYARQFDLNVHLRSHTGEQPYACHLCDKRFAIKVRLTYHLQKHYGIKHQCKECGAEFNSKQKLKAHSFKHTGMPYRCELCDDHGFATRNVFKRHLDRVHHATITEEALNDMFQKNTGKAVKIKQINVEDQTTDDDTEDAPEIHRGKPLTLSSSVVLMETEEIISNI